LSNEITHPTVDVDAIRSKINDDSVRLIDVRREEDYNQDIFLMRELATC